MTKKSFLIIALFLMVGCSNNTTPVTESAANNKIDTPNNVSISPITIIEAEENIISSSPEIDDIETSVTERTEIMIPSDEFMELRDEILIEILGIDSNLPIYYPDKNDPNYIELPYGGVYMKLGDYDYRVSLSKINFGFNLKPASTYRFYYSNEGIEIDVVYQDDSPYELVRYLYISNTSKKALPNGISIGSTKDEIINMYEPFIITNFLPMLTDEEVIALGSNLNGIYFVIREDRVYSIYIGIVNENSRYSWFLTTRSNGISLYPDWFYPDREYIESIQE
ncbi:MAG: hypothetical protein FWG88_11055 [Oscillospiraceae bacterium]|nr:hypothetical protein [Oscillospiraceae bacterium]